VKHPSSEVQYQVWQAADDEDFFDRVPDCPMVCVYTGVVAFADPGPDGTAEDFQKALTRTLERLFEIFNIDHPEGFAGHSLSIHDVICIGENSFRCAPLGWEPCPAPSESGLRETDRPLPANPEVLR
jgi:hypothetical protein